MFYLHRLDDNSEVRMRSEMTVGRSETDVKITGDKAVSKQHCVFRVTGDTASVMDLDSATGTFVNGIGLEPNVPLFLNHNDIVKLGDVSFRFVDEKIEELLKLPSILEALHFPQIRIIVSVLTLLLVFYFSIEKGLTLGLKYPSFMVIVFLLLCWGLTIASLSPVAKFSISIGRTPKLRWLLTGVWTVLFFATFSIFAGFGQVVVPSVKYISTNRIYYHCIKNQFPRSCKRAVSQCQNCLQALSINEKLYVKNILRRSIERVPAQQQKRRGR